MTRAYVEAPATHYRLSKETWAIIAEEYKNGATAKDLGAKWKIAPSSVYRYACRDGFTKKGMGDARSRAHARLVEEEEAAARSLHPVGSRALKTLFQPAPVDRPEASDPSALTETATLASGRAMKGRLWAEAKALAGLAESYSRLADKGGRGGGGSVAAMDLALLCEIVVDADGAVRRRFRRIMDGRDDPDLPIKERYWIHVIRRHDAVDHNLKELMFRALSAERELRRLGGTPKINRTDVEIEEWVRHWLGEPLTEANFDHRTQLGEWPWR